MPVSPSSALPPSTRTGSLFTLPRKSMTNAFAGCSKTSIGVPSCSIFPLFITTTRSATSNASSWSCVTKMLVTWNSSWNRRSQVAQFAADLGVECAERLVEQQHLRLRRERADERDALPLPAGELGRIAVRLLFQPHEAEQFHHAVADFLLAAPCGRAGRRRRSRTPSCGGTGRSAGTRSRRCGRGPSAW